MITIKKYHQTFRTLLLLCIALATTLTLLISATAFHIPGFSTISFAHAMVTRKVAAQVQFLCPSNPNAQNCTNQDPVVQGCDKDAQTVAFKDMADAQGNFLAILQRRYSPTCHSEWGRIANDGKQPLQIIVNETTRSTTGKVAYSTMVFVPNLSVAPQVTGFVSINGITPGNPDSAALNAILPALSSPQNL